MVFHYIVTWKVPEAQPVRCALHCDSSAVSIKAQSHTPRVLQTVLGSASWHCLSFMQVRPSETASVPNSTRFRISVQKETIWLKIQSEVPLPSITCIGFDTQDILCAW